MTYSPGRALRTIGWSNPRRFDSFTPEIDLIRDLVAICGAAGAARRMRITERELNQVLAAGEAPIVYVATAFLILRRRLKRHQRTMHSELVRPENQQLRAMVGKAEGVAPTTLH